MATAPKKARINQHFRVVLRPTGIGVKAPRKILRDVTNRQNQTIDTKPAPEPKKGLIDFSDPLSYYQPPHDIDQYPNVVDFDRNQLHDSYAEPHYAWDIFSTEKSKETRYATIKYLELGGPNNKSMNRTNDINAKTRAILVDWMVQMQDGLSLNHEVLYMAVKIVDQYLARKPASEDNPELLGVVALLISCKLDERRDMIPPIDELLDNTRRLYSRQHVIHFEIEVLKTLEFDIAYPLSYRFLRRFARCTGCNLKVLTLARYILESSLLEYEFVDQLESKMAAAALLLAFKMMNMPDCWSDTAVFYTKYSERQLLSLVFKLNAVISRPVDRSIAFVKTKYENHVFMQVATIAPLSTQRTITSYFT